jgi:hypothetical protein
VGGGTSANPVALALLAGKAPRSAEVELYCSLRPCDLLASSVNAFDSRRPLVSFRLLPLRASRAVRKNSSDCASRGRLISIACRTRQAPLN